tara:strand:+ start:53 stop:391 length:339 start_codon:yes stop_codon:yes gene_type:complete
MKNLMMTAAVAAMIFATANTNAQSTQAEKTLVKTEVAVQEGFQKIETSNVPDAVKAAVQKDFEGASIAEAYINKKKEFKLVLESEGGEAKTVYANAKGEWIKPSSKMTKMKK